jgi:hypothetical protein
VRKEQGVHQRLGGFKLTNLKRDSAIEHRVSVRCIEEANPSSSSLQEKCKTCVSELIFKGQDQERQCRLRSGVTEEKIKRLSLWKVQRFFIRRKVKHAGEKKIQLSSN